MVTSTSTPGLGTKTVQISLGAGLDGDRGDLLHYLPLQIANDLHTYFIYILLVMKFCIDFP